MSEATTAEMAVITSSAFTAQKIALLACGCFNPPTYMHLRMFERARDYLQKNGCEVVEGIISPVADAFGKPGLVPAKHRLRMCELITKNSDWIRVDGWEANHPHWSRSLVVLNQVKSQLDTKYASTSTGSVRLMLLCGGDVVDSFPRLTPTGDNLWDPNDVMQIARDFGIIILSRIGSNPMATIYSLDHLRAQEKNIRVIEDETCPNDISSTRLRMALRRGESIKYCTDDAVIEYIKAEELYLEPSPPLCPPAVVQDTRSAYSFSAGPQGQPYSKNSIDNAWIQQQQQQLLQQQLQHQLQQHQQRQQQQADAVVWNERKSSTGSNILRSNAQVVVPISCWEPMSDALYDNVSEVRRETSLQLSCVPDRPSSCMVSPPDLESRRGAARGRESTSRSSPSSLIIRNTVNCGRGRNSGTFSAAKNRSQSGEFRTIPGGRNIRFATDSSASQSLIQARSVDNITTLHIGIIPVASDSDTDSDAKSNVTLRFKGFKLSPTPETTV